jgi:two-component system NtrC family sensor kinase
VWNGVYQGDRSLLAFARVKAHSDFIVIFRRPWSALVEHLRQQAWALLAILLFGVFLASMAGLWLSAFLTRPLALLRASAARIATGQRGAAADLRLMSGRDELGALVHDFLEMERAIEQRDRALRDAKSSLEHRVVERTAELQVAQQALVEAERFAAMGKTSAAIAHELKNALNGLGMAVELILEAPANPRVGRLRTQVLYEIDRLRDVVDSLSSFSHTPRIRLRVEDVTAVVASAVELLSDLIADRDASVRVVMPAQFLLSCDGHKIQGVIMNLVKNAVEAATLVEIRARFDGEQAVIEVDDNGPGMSDEAKQHLFEPFFTTKPNGTGLGLPTSLRYVRAHGGQITVDSAPDLGGARVRVVLPRQPEAAT